MKHHPISLYCWLILLIFSFNRLWCSRGTIHVTIVNEKNQQIYHHREAYSADSMAVNDGFQGLYSTVLRSTLYPDANAAFSELMVSIPNHTLLIFDRHARGVAVHMLPPQAFGTDIVYHGHLAGDKYPNGEGGYCYVNPHCCKNLHRGMLMTFTPEQLQAQQTMLPVNQKVATSALYHAGYTMVENSIRQANGTMPPSGNLRYDPLTYQQPTYQKPPVDEAWNQSSFTASTYMDDKTFGAHIVHNDSGAYLTVGVTHPLCSHPLGPSYLTYPEPDPLLTQPVGYFYDRFKHCDPETLLHAFALFEYDGYKAFLPSVPKFKEHLKMYYYNITHYTLESLFWRAVGVPGYLIGRRFTEFHVGKHIKKMYAQMVALEEEEARIAQEEELKKSWARENRIASIAHRKQAHEAFLHSIEHAPYDTNDPQAYFLSDEYAQIIHQLMFFEQADMDPEKFYAFYGTDQQNNLHDRMRSFVLHYSDYMHSASLAVHNGEDLANTFARHALSTAFMANSANYTEAAERLFALVQAMYDDNNVHPHHRSTVVVAPIVGYALLINSARNNTVGGVSMTLDEYALYVHQWNMLADSVLQRMQHMHHDDWQTTYLHMKDVDWESEVGSSIFDVVIEKNPNAAQEFFRNKHEYEQIAKVAQNKTADVIVRCNQYRQAAWDNAHAMQSDVWEWRGEASRYAEYSAPEKQTPIRKKVHAIRTAIKKQYCAEQQKKYLDEIVQLQQTAHNHRYHSMCGNRLQALDGAYRNSFSRQTYHFTVGDELLKFAAYYDIPTEQLTHGVMNAYEHQLHQEFIEQLTHATAYDREYNHVHETAVFLDMLAEGIAVGLQANHLHRITVATQWADYGWGALEILKGVCEGVYLGTERCAHMFVYPLEGLNNIAVGIGMACVLVGKTMVTTLIIDDPMEFKEFDEAEKLIIDEALLHLDVIKKQCCDALKSMSAREKTKHIVAFGVESALTKKALNALIAACDNVGPLALEVLTSLNDATQTGEFAVAGIGNITVDLAKGSAATLASFMDGDMPKIGKVLAVAAAAADTAKEAATNDTATTTESPEQQTHPQQQEPPSSSTPESIPITPEEQRTLLQALEKATKESLNKEIKTFEGKIRGFRKGFDRCANKDIKISYEHILTPEFQFTKKGIPHKISGFHHDPMNILENSSGIQFANKIKNKFNCYEANIYHYGKKLGPKTFFPAEWSPEQVMNAIYEAYDDFIAKGAIFEIRPGGKYRISGFTIEGIEIEMFVTPKGQITTAYPILKG